MRQLILFRHSKTEPFSDEGSDETRALTERGHDDASFMAFKLRDLGITPSRVLISTARRTRETWNQLKLAFPDLSPIFSETLYLADPDEIISVLEDEPDSECVVVIGHNPGMHELSLKLAELGGSRNDDAFSTLRMKFPTSAMAIFEAKDDKPFAQDNFELVDFLVPSALRV